MSSHSSAELLRNIAAAQQRTLATEESFFIPWLRAPRDAEPRPARANALVRNRRLLLLGEPGAGKTRLLRWWVGSQQRRLLAKQSRTGALLLDARTFNVALAQDSALVPALSRALGEHFGVDAADGNLAALLREGRLVLVLDSLDELPSLEQRRRCVHELLTALHDAQLARLVVASRPVGLDAALGELPARELAGLDHTQIAALLRASWPDEEPPYPLVELAKAAGGNARVVRMLASLASRETNPPLTATTLWQALLDAQIWQLSEWIALDTPSGTVGHVQLALEALALAQLSRGSDVLPRGEAMEVVASAVGPQLGTRLLDVVSTRADMVLQETGHDEFSFAHRSLAEFLVASSLRQRPEAAVPLLRREGAERLLLFAAGLLDDPEPLIEAALEERGAEFATALFEQLAGRSAAIRTRVAGALIARLSADLDVAPPSPPPPPTAEGFPEPCDHDALLERWRVLLRSQARGDAKGRELEEFLISFFGCFFEVVEHRYRTGLGEIDLLITNRQPLPFWLQFAADMFVEAKNTSAAVDLPVVNAFAGKVSGSRTTLGFVVSTNGFTRDALARAASTANAGPLIVPLRGEQIERMLLEREPFASFFERVVRDVLYQRPL